MSTLVVVGSTALTVAGAIILLLLNRNSKKDETISSNRKSNAEEKIRHAKEISTLKNDTLEKAISGIEQTMESFKKIVKDLVTKSELEAAIKASEEKNITNIKLLKKDYVLHMTQYNGLARDMATMADNKIIEDRGMKQQTRIQIRENIALLGIFILDPKKAKIKAKELKKRQELLLKEMGKSTEDNKSKKTAKEKFRELSKKIDDEVINNYKENDKK